MTRTNLHPIRPVKHLIYDLRSADVPEFIFITEAAASVINSAFHSLGYEYRFFPISHIKGDPSERSN